MGRAARTNFPEFWEFYPVQGLVDAIFETARPFRAEDQRLLVHRHGKLEEAYFTFSISHFSTMMERYSVSSTHTSRRRLACSANAEWPRCAG